MPAGVLRRGGAETERASDTGGSGRSDLWGKGCNVMGRRKGLLCSGCSVERRLRFLHMWSLGHQRNFRRRRHGGVLFHGKSG